MKKVLDEAWLDKCIDFTEKEIVALRNLVDTFSATHIAHGRLKAYLFVKTKLQPLSDEGETNLLVSQLKEGVMRLLSEGDTDAPYLIKGSKTYSKRQLSEALQNGQPEGVEILNNLLQLTIDMVERGKKVLP